nr:CorA family divalent cation transporter [Armatimonas sp.]
MAAGKVSRKTLGRQYSAQVAQRTNETMRLLTVVTVLLLPIGTLAGILGVNF